MKQSKSFVLVNSKQNRKKVKRFKGKILGKIKQQNK